MLQYTVTWTAWTVNMNSKHFRKWIKRRTSITGLWWKLNVRNNRCSPQNHLLARSPSSGGAFRAAMMPGALLHVSFGFFGTLVSGKGPGKGVQTVTPASLGCFGSFLQVTEVFFGCGVLVWQQREVVEDGRGGTQLLMVKDKVAFVRTLENWKRSGLSWNDFWKKSKCYNQFAIQYL